MKIVIAGAGAMGSLLGGLLAESGADITLYDICQDKIAAISAKGLLIEREGKKRRVMVGATADRASLPKADLVLIMVKSYDTGVAIRQVKSCLKEKTMVLTLQNGWGNVDAITGIVPSQQVLAGVTSHGAMLLAPGIVRHNGGAKTFIGPINPEIFPDAKHLADFFSGAGIETLAAENIVDVIWTKLVVNAVINPLTALTRLRNGELLKHPELLQIMGKIVQEAEEVSLARGIRLQEPDMLSYVVAICKATAHNRSSMLEDILKNRPTEIDAINGMIVWEGKKNNRKTPINEIMVGLIRVLEKGEGLFQS